MTATENPYRLPRTAAPSRYDLVLRPDLAAGTFTGSVDIAVAVHEPTTELVCNAADLEIQVAEVRLADGRALPATPSLEPETQRLRLTLPATLEPGPCTVHFEFTGILNDKLRGWYRSTFRDQHGEQRVIATSQMQSTDCRRAFPCWDEPDFKAVFGITLIVPPDLLALSNGAEVDRRPEGDLVRVTFADTMPMSTYLVALIVGPLEVSAPVDVDGIPLRVVHVPGKGHLTGLAKDIGAFALRWFQDYYGIPYPAGKVDLVALPDFAFGAMENVGCITFRETALLFDAERGTQADAQRVADVVAHELAHMWFGDLVTMRWWNGIWLNEAFATFMEVAACEAFRPAWDRWTSFSLERTPAFDVDSLQSTRPIEFEVVSPSDAEGMFDVLTYQKGGALLRMLEQHLGTEAFRDGIRLYLDTHRYGNTETSDLWDALEQATGEPVRALMDTWIWQGGHPLVSARVQGGELVLSQQRFLFDGDDDGRRWAVPLHVRQLTPGGGEHVDHVVLDGDELRVPVASPDATVFVNGGAHGFFRTHYAPELLARLTGPALTRLSTAERYSLVEDVWASVVAGRTRADEFCRFARGFGDEGDVRVWRILLNGLGWFDRFVEDGEREHFQAFVRALVGPALQRLGWEVPPGADPLAGELRGVLVTALAVLGNDGATQQRAREVHARRDGWDPALIAASVTVVAATGDEHDWDTLLDEAEHARSPQDHDRNLYALAELPSADLMARTLQLALSGRVRTQNAPFLLSRCIANRRNGAQAWRFVREHWDELGARFPTNLIIRMVDPVRTLSRPEEQADVSAFFAEHPVPQGRVTLAQILERQRVNTALRVRAEGDLATLFADG